MPKVKPLRLPPSFDEAVADLLKVKPPAKAKAKRRKPSRKKP